jgi:hypothetical protein
MRPAAVALCCYLTACLALAAPAPKPKEAELYKPGWDKPLDPDKDCKFRQTKNELTLTVPAKDHDYDPRRKQLNAPRLLRDVEGDFVVEARVGGELKATADSSVKGAVSHAAGGLFVMLGNKSGVTVHLMFGSRRDGGEPVAFVAFQAPSANGKGGAFGLWKGDHKRWFLPAGAKHAYLRIERRGDTIGGWVSADGKEWLKYMHPITYGDKPAAKLKVGLIATSTSKDEVKVTFDQFKLTTLPAENKAPK